MALTQARDQPLRWVGPSELSPFTKEYAQDEVKSPSCSTDGEMAPKDLRIRKNGAVARLERGNTKGGRTNKHGLIYNFGDASGCSHRHPKAELDTTCDDEGHGLVHL